MRSERMETCGKIAGGFGHAGIIGRSEEGRKGVAKRLRRLEKHEIDALAARLLRAPCRREHAHYADGIKLQVGCCRPRPHGVD